MKAKPKNKDLINNANWAAACLVEYVNKVRRGEKKFKLLQEAISGSKRKAMPMVFMATTLGKQRLARAKALQVKDQPLGLAA